MRRRDPGEAHEVANGIPVGAAGAAFAEIGEPLDLWRDLGETVEGIGGQEPAAGPERRGRASRWFPGRWEVPAEPSRIVFTRPTTVPVSANGRDQDGLCAANRGVAFLNAGTPQCRPWGHRERDRWPVQGAALGSRLEAVHV